MTCANAKFNILLTSFNEKKRQPMTRDIIKYYTNTLKFPKNQIFIVDSSNNGVGENLIPKENQIVFDQKKQCKSKINPRGSSFYEGCSLREVVKNKEVMKAMSAKPYTVKMTTKYKLPELCNALKQYKDEKYIVQSSHNKNWQNTEVFAVSTDEFEEFANIYCLGEKKCAESWMSDFCKENKCDRMKPLKNEASYRRGAGDHLKNL